MLQSRCRVCSENNYLYDTSVAFENMSYDEIMVKLLTLFFDDIANDNEKKSLSSVSAVGIKANTEQQHFTV